MRTALLIYTLFQFVSALLFSRACSICHPIRPQLFSTQRTVNFGSATLPKIVNEQPSLFFAALMNQRVVSDRLLSNDIDTDSTKADDESQESENDHDKILNDETPALSTAMIASIGFYKEFISPLLPPACRFLPTCSQYGVQAIKEFGPCKGAVLTSWRLLRCSPIGGKGYDPPKWPPVAYWYSSY
jgi:putative membrane protein insertion efficiency factor